jgi:biopolymer transport protein ExbD
MASNFDPNSDDGINDINITPFVDVVLVLLVIFMVTAPIMVKESLNIKLPKSESADNSKLETFGIAINANGQILLNGELKSTESLEIEATLKLTENKNLQALISADKETKHGDIIKVIDIIKKVGIENFAFQIERLIKE